MACYSPRVLMLRRKIHRFVWLCVVAMAGIAVGPTISRTLAAGSGASAEPAHWHGIEAAHSMPMASAPARHEAGPASEPAAPHAPSLDHCELCVLAASAWAFASVPHQPVLDPFEFHFVVLPPIVSAARRVVWPPATPRGPPTLG